MAISDVEKGRRLYVFCRMRTVGLPGVAQSPEWDDLERSIQASWIHRANVMFPDDVSSKELNPQLEEIKALADSARDEYRELVDDFTRIYDEYVAFREKIVDLTDSHYDPAMPGEPSGPLDKELFRKIREDYKISRMRADRLKRIRDLLDDDEIVGAYAIIAEIDEIAREETVHRGS